MNVRKRPRLVVNRLGISIQWWMYWDVEVAVGEYEERGWPLWYRTVWWNRPWRVYGPMGRVK